MTVCVTPLYFCNLHANFFVLSKSAGFCRYIGISRAKKDQQKEKKTIHG